MKEEQRIQEESLKQIVYPDGETEESIRARHNEYLMQKQSTQNMYQFLCCEVINDTI